MTPPDDEPAIILADPPALEDQEAIRAALRAFNQQQLDRLGTPGPVHTGPLAFLLRRPGTGETVGGLWASVSFDWMSIDFLFVPDEWRGRGLGARLLAVAEAEAKKRGCAGLWLNTFGFQAPTFYQKAGFEVFGTLDDNPRGSQRLFLRKRIDGA